MRSLENEGACIKTAVVQGGACYNKAFTMVNRQTVKVCVCAPSSMSSLRDISKWTLSPFTYASCTVCRLWYKTYWGNFQLLLGDKVSQAAALGCSHHASVSSMRRLAYRHATELLTCCCMPRYNMVHLVTQANTEQPKMPPKTLGKAIQGKVNTQTKSVKGRMHRHIPAGFLRSCQLVCIPVCLSLSLCQLTPQPCQV